MSVTLQESPCDESEYWQRHGRVWWSPVFQRRDRTSGKDARRIRTRQRVVAGEVDAAAARRRRRRAEFTITQDAAT
jgi:hypothetical protein